jgi:hypothetical protein
MAVGLAVLVVVALSTVKVLAVVQPPMQIPYLLGLAGLPS